MSRSWAPRRVGRLARRGPKDVHQVDAPALDARRAADGQVRREGLGDRRQRRRLGRGLDVQDAERMSAGLSAATMAMTALLEAARPRHRVVQLPIERSACRRRPQAAGFAR